MLVATIHLRNGEVSNILACYSERSCEYIGRINNFGAFYSPDNFFSIKKHVASISYWPVIKIRMSPGGC